MVGKATLVMNSVINGAVFSLLWWSKVFNGVIRFFER